MLASLRAAEALKSVLASLRAAEALKSVLASLRAAEGPRFEKSRTQLARFLASADSLVHPSP